MTIYIDPLICPIINTREMKPLEVEIVVAEAGDDRFADHDRNALYRVQFDGSITDERGFCVIGGTVENLQSHLQSNYREGLPLGDALRLGRDTLQHADDGETHLEPKNLEVGVLDRNLTGRKFLRLSAEELEGILRA